MPNPRSPLETAQALVLSLTPEDRKRLAEWLKNTNSSLIEESPKHSRVASSLYRVIAEAVGRRGGMKLESLSTMARLRPAQARNLEVLAGIFEGSLHSLFGGCTIVQLEAVRTFMVRCACNRLEERKRLIDLQGVLDALIPLEELVDDCFPGYRASGVLKEEILRALHAKG
jgi:hypothetical protein